VFDLLCRDRASAGLSDIGKAADGASRNTDALTKRLNELSRKSVEARVKLAGDKEAQASLDKMDARLISLDRRVASPNMKVEGAARAIAEISAVELELDKVGGKGGTAETATASLGLSGLSGPSGMGALIGAGVALSPVIATLGVGLGGLGLAALSTTKNAKEMAAVLAPLKTEFGQFSASLQPEVLGVFNEGVKLAGHLLADIEPVARATGTAFSGFLGQVDKMFASGEFKGFFDWMAQQAAPDMQLLGGLVIDLTKDLPPLLMSLQPAARLLLLLADGAAKAVGGLEHLHLALPILGAAIGAMVAGPAAPIGALIGGLAGVALEAAAAGDAVDKAAMDFSKLPDSAHLATAATVNWQVVAATMTATLITSGTAAQVTAVKTANLAKEVAYLTGVYSKALSPLLAYSNAQIAQAGDAVALNTALKASHDRIGLNTAAQRASFTAANTYIQDLLNTASAASKSGQGVDAQIRSIRSALPALEHVKGGTTAYWQEVQKLVGWLARLEAQKAITQRVTVFGNGQWTVNPVTGPGSTGGGHQLAAGGRVPGTGTGDTVPAMLTPGEVVIPRQMVAAGAVDHLRGRLPGFASGGIVPGYSGALAGLQPWGEHNQLATIAAITSGIAGTMAKQFAAIAASGFLGPGSGNYAADISTVLSSLGLPLSLVGNWLSQIQTESGGNLGAVNLTDSNAAAGHPSVGLLQLIPSTFALYAGPYRTTPPLVNFGGGVVSENPMAQIYAAIHYALAAYGTNMAAVIGHGHGYDNGGVLPPGVTLAVNGTGHDEYVTRTPPRGGDTYNITVTVPVGTSPAETGREIARCLLEFKKRGGRY
jgi:hypothetical protein